MSGAGRGASEAGGPGIEAELLDVARAAARAAAGELLTRYDAAPEGVATKSTATDPVSEADRAAERAIRAVLAQRRPHDSVLGEEGGETAAAAAGAEGSGLRWVVDPLDGTVNYLFGYPQWSVSVACEDGAGAIAGVVLDPLRDEEVAATRSGPLLLDGQPHPRAAGAASLDVALVATGFAYDAAVRARQAALLPRLLPRVRDLRRGGSAALDLAWTALGRCDAYFERGVQSWDVAAGALACACAGLELHELPSHAGEPAGLLAAPPALAADLLALVTHAADAA